MAASASVFEGLKRVDAAAVSALNLDPIDDKTRKQALDIVLAVRDGGEPALLDLASKFKDLPEGAHTVPAEAQIPSGSARCNSSHPENSCRREAYFDSRRSQECV